MNIGPITGPISGGIRRIEDLAKILPLHRIRQLHPDPAPEARSALTLVEDGRAQVLDALPYVTCMTIGPDAPVREHVTSWQHVEDVVGDSGAELIDALCAARCPDAPMGAAVVAAWRGLAGAALDYRDGNTTWRIVTDSAERLATFVHRSCAQQADLAGW